jgi:hypothetical protein
MAYSLHTYPQGRCLQATLENERYLSSAAPFWISVSEMLAEASLRNLIVEIRRETRLSVFEIFEWASNLQKWGLSISTRIALVLPPENASELSFAETVLVNRGFTATAFLSLDKARYWLS